MMDFALPELLESFYTYMYFFPLETTFWIFIHTFKTLSLNLALTLGCLNPKNLNPSVTNPNPDSNANPQNCQ